MATSLSAAKLGHSPTVNVDPAVTDGPMLLVDREYRQFELSSKEGLSARMVRSFDLSALNHANETDASIALKFKKSPFGSIDEH